MLSEISVPAGYNLAPDVVFTYRDSQQTQPTVSVTVANTHAYFRLRKVNPQGNPVAGATLAVLQRRSRNH